MKKHVLKEDYFALLVPVSLGTRMYVMINEVAKAMIIPKIIKMKYSPT